MTQNYHSMETFFLHAFQHFSSKNLKEWNELTTPSANLLLNVLRKLLFTTGPILDIPDFKKMSRIKMHCLSSIH